MTSDRLSPEDYQDDRCVLIDQNTGEKCSPSGIPIMRIVEKLDAYCAEGNYAAASRHLDYWIAEADMTGDRRGAFSVYNEMMGFYRKQGDRKRAMDALQKAEELIGELGIEGSASAATCYVNCATVHLNFGEAEEAMPYFEKACGIMESLKNVPPEKMGGLYNNMGLALSDLGRYAEAFSSFEKALAFMEKKEGSEGDLAITYLNMADALTMEGEAEDDIILAYVEKARQMLDSPSAVRDAYYAYICRRCAPGFSYYDMPEYAEELKARADGIGEDK